MKTLHVNLAERRYPIMVGQGLMADAGRRLAKLGFSSPPVVIANNRILRLHGSALLESLREEFGRIHTIRIGDGERFKNHASLFRIYEGMFRAHADRRSWILAFGGGVTGDIAGYAAATFMRGIPYVMVPTTLLAQVDSSMGGKVGINVVHGKNLIGAFHQPTAVISDTDALKTLPKRELVSGLFEVVKCGAIRSVPLLGYLERRLPEIRNCRGQELQHIILESSRIKADVVARDEKEGGLRMILNYGHTVGHAVEAATASKRFKHGEAVAWGMIAAVGFGRELGCLSAPEAERLIRLIRRVGSLPSLKGISFSNLWEALTRDKKFRSGDIRMVLLRELGNAEIRSGIDSSRLRQFLKGFLAANGRICG
jgi:3-dehydroquinate synthase